jgi:hypothetical protein
MSQKTVKTVRPDKKGRITLGNLLEGASSVKVSVNDDGTITLEPYTEIPLKELWLYEDTEALDKVRNGLKQAAEGSLNDLGTFSRFE